MFLYQRRANCLICNFAPPSKMTSLTRGDQIGGLLLFYYTTKYRLKKYLVLTWVSVTQQCLEDISHFLQIGCADFCVIHNGFGVVLSNDASGRLLHTLWGCPWSMDVFCWKSFQDWQVFSENNSPKSVSQKRGLE